MKEPKGNLNMHDSRIGEFVRRKTCRFCQSEKMTEILDLGTMPLAGAFLKEPDFPNEKFYPLTLNFCEDCSLVQVSDVVPAEVLFKNDYFFFSSAIETLVEHFKTYASEIHSRFLKGVPSPAVLEIGCNDGVLLKPFLTLGVKAIGVDPATNVVKKIDAKGAIVVNDFFTEKLADDISSRHGQVDAVVSSFSFAHIDDMVDVVKGVKRVLKDEGVFVFELYYMGTLLEEMQYDMIYHEHMSYYALVSLRKFLGRFGMEIFDVKFIPGVRSGSVRFYARNIGKRNEPISDAVSKMADYEQEKKFDSISGYREYADKIRTTKVQIVTLLEKLKSEGKTIIGYGASGRGTVIMNYCGIDSRYLDYVVDDAPAKQGYYTPGTHVPIKSWDFVEKSGFPDYIVLFAWAFTDEVLKKRKDYIDKGGKFIIPLPEVKVFPA